jgi:hypothetical protein
MNNNNISLLELTKKARAEFPTTTFWNLVVIENSADDARNVGRQLTKYGGMRGLKLASVIEKTLISAGERSWR